MTTIGVAGEDFWESLGQQGDYTSHLKGDKPWIFTGRTNAKAEAPVFWSSVANRWLNGKVTDPKKDWGQEEKKASEDQMTGWNHQCNEHELGKLWEMVRDREAWQTAVHGIAKGWTRPDDWTTIYVYMWCISE